LTTHKLVRVKIDDLRVGMYVVLNLAWYEHPFLKGEFLVTSEADIRKLKSLGLKEIAVDSSQSQLKTDANPLKQTQKHAPEEKKEAREIIPTALFESIHDERMPPQQKAAIVQQHSFTMMKNLLDSPSAENIKEAKKGISEVVNLILKDDATLFYLLNITEHDYYTYTHSVSVGVLGVALSKSLFKKSSAHDIHALGAGFFLHDIGKVHIDLNIINKPGKLTDEEMNEMRRHPALGYKLLTETKQLTEESKIIVLQHHERADGKGYPKGLHADEIHIYGKICAIADVYDALTSERPYKKKMLPFEALRLMHDQMINHFQKDMFEKFVLLLRAPS